MYETIVYLETTLRYQDAKRILPNADYLPSIKKGDVLRAIQKGYRRIVIIDGNFSWVPSVWHKEILTALEYGLEVWGASSMGALRAAELDVFGMKGYGHIYKMFKNEEIDGDDEVAIAYSKYNNEKTIPLINIRLTIGRLNLPNKDEIIESIRSIFYAERTWSRIEQKTTKKAYKLIKSNYLDMKKEDAKSLLYLLKKRKIFSNLDSFKKERGFTIFEKKLIESTFPPVWLKYYKGEKRGNMALFKRADNLLKFISIPQTKENILSYQSLISLLDEQGYDITPHELLYHVEIFREERNLLKGEEFFAWLKERELCEVNLELLFSDYVKLSKYLSITYDYNSFFN